MFAFDVDQAWFNSVIDVGKTRRIATRPVSADTQTHIRFNGHRPSLTSVDLCGHLLAMIRI